MKNQKGITLVIIVATVVVMAIIVGTISYNSMSSFKLNQYYKMCADIELLDEKIALYYLEHKDDADDTNFGLPIDDEKVEASATSADKVNYNPNNSGNLYKIDLTKLDNLSLNNTGDFYIDKQSHTIYYSYGIEIEGDTYYTVPVDYQDVSDVLTLVQQQ